LLTRKRTEVQLPPAPTIKALTSGNAGQSAV
jgi:hypothetical protein